MNDIFENDVDDINEEEVLRLKSKVKEMEKRLREKNKPKTITISGSDHAKIKAFCSSLNLNIGDWVSRTLLKEILENSCIIVDKSSNDEQKNEREIGEIKDRYFNSLTRKIYLLKSNKIITNKDFIFMGYSIIDGRAIYEFTGDMNLLRLTHDFDSMGLKFNNSSREELSKYIFSNEELEHISF